MRKIFPYLLSAVVISILFANCEKESVIGAHLPELQKSPVKVRTVQLSEIPTVLHFLKTKTNLKFTKSTEIDGAIFDEENVIEVIDTLNRVNYSLRFSYPDTPVGTFYNLIVGKTPEGETKTPYVLKYVCDEANLNEYIANNFNFRFFKGSVTLHKYTDFFQQGSFSKSSNPICPPTTDSNGDLIPCDTIEVDGNSGGTDGEEIDLGDSETNNGEIDGADVTDPGGSYDGNTGDTDESNEGSEDIAPCTEWEWVPILDIYDENGNYESTIGEYKCVSTSQKMASIKTGVDDCPECGEPSGPIGINEPNELDPVNPCEKLNDLLTKTAFKDALLNLQQAADNNADSERGFEISKNERGDVTTNFVQGGFDGVELGSSEDIVGGMHIHTNSGDPMFSGQDIDALRVYFSNGQIENTNNSTTSDAVSILVVKIGGSVQTFAITINNYTYLRYIIQTVDKSKGGENLDDELQNGYDNTINGTNTNAYMQDLLKYMNSLSPIPAINLHKLNSDGTAFEKVILDANNNNSPTSNPCQ